LCGKCACITPSRSTPREKEGKVITAVFTEEILALSCEMTTPALLRIVHFLFFNF
jgi:hypothetical protein